MNTSISRACAVALTILAPCAATAASAPSAADQWPVYGRTGSTNFSPLSQITPANVSNLKQAWVYNFGAGTHDVGDLGLDYRFEVQPLLVGGVLYISTPTSPRAPGLKSTVTALEPETGKVLWKYESPRNIHGRGLAYWPGDRAHGPRFFFGTRDGYLSAVDIKTGKAAQNFGKDGTVDAYAGVVSERVGESRRSTYTIPNPVTVYRNLVITGSRPGEGGPPGPRGDIRAWDAVTGKLVWTFHTVPQAGEAFHETYKNPAETLDRSGPNVWSTMTLDAERGILFAPLGDLNGRAEGSELFASTLVALDAATGRLKWHQQLTHKDLWDWDLPTPPVLAEIKKDGRTIPAVIQGGKTSLIFMFNRETGEPIHGLEERPTPRSDDPADLAWPTQPFPTRPGPVARVRMTREEIPDVAPGLKDYCTRFWDEGKTVNFGLYTRPMLNNGTVTFPASSGSPNWGPPSYNPQTGFYIINVQNIGGYRTAGPAGRGFGVGPAPAAAPAPAQPPERRAGPAETPTAEAVAPVRPTAPPPNFQFRTETGDLIPCSPTPWAELVAVDTNRGEIAWRVPLGNWEALGDKGIGLGTRNLGGNISTAGGVTFIGATNDRIFRAFESSTGKLLWQTDLPASAHATPVSYLGKDGHQYVVTAAAGGTAIGVRRMSDALIAYRLDDGR